MTKNKKITKTITLMFVFVFSFTLFNQSYASITNGTIDSTNKYAYGENIGWINFSSSNSTISITDTELTGFAYNENTGWISLNCSNTDTCSNNNYKVSNTTSGVLSGYAYGENIGWINFSGVSINSSGEFTGYAYNENTGYISFNCLNTDTCSNNAYKVTTDWRPASQRPQCNNQIDDDGDGRVDYPADTGCTSLTDDNEANPSSGGGIPINMLNNINQQNQTNNNQETENTSSEAQTPDFWTNGKFIKTESNETIYFVDSSNMKHEYSQENVWHSYFGDDFSKVQIVSKQELDSYLTGDSVPYKKDSLVKTISNPKVYKVTENKILRWITNENVATRLFGNIWNKMINDIAEVFFNDYSIGENIE